MEPIMTKAAGIYNALFFWDEHRDWGSKKIIMNFSLVSFVFFCIIIFPDPWEGG